MEYQELFDNAVKSEEKMFELTRGHMQEYQSLINSLPELPFELLGMWFGSYGYPLFITCKFINKVDLSTAIQLMKDAGWNFDEQRVASGAVSLDFYKVGYFLDGITFQCQTTEQTTCKIVELGKETKIVPIYEIICEEAEKEMQNA